MRHISTNKYEFNLRQVESISRKMLGFERALESTEGFLNKFRIKRELRKLNKEVKVYGEEILHYEQNNIIY